MASFRFAGIAVLALLLACTACDPATRYRTLSTFFDGVPPPAAPAPAGAAKNASAPVPMRASYREHGPYAARLCSACHQSVASNTLVLPKDKLCRNCHTFGPDKKVLHDPFESGECLDCHDPHSGPYPGILAGKLNDICHGCHEAETLADEPAHADADKRCTDCHDPHQSDKENLLR
ncbi:MAG TPA: cytochrome c3 family protein [Candidatus Binatia bacterium]